MITDNQTNLVYFSSLLKEKYPKFWDNLETILKKHSIPYKFIENTRDIWCRDYMPIQLSEKDFLQFQYFPDYYILPKYIHLLTLQDELKWDKPFWFNVRKVELIVDGGNIVKSQDKAIMVDKVFKKENPTRDPDVVKRNLKKELNVDELYFIPHQPDDITGHADGMVRYYDENTILVNEFDESPSWMEKFNRAINATELNKILFPYQYHTIRNNSEYTAHGCYINFAQIGNVIIFPQFAEGLKKEDEQKYGNVFRKKDAEALQKIKALFPEPNYHVEPIYASEIAYDGGVLNCCTWNVADPLIENAVKKIRPIASNNNLLLIALQKDYEKWHNKSVIDILCIKINLKTKEHESPWSFEKYMKFSGYYVPIEENQVEHFRNEIKKVFNDYEISSFYKMLMRPTKEVV